MNLLKKEGALSLHVKEVNDTAGPAVLVPTLLVFRVFSRLPVHLKDLPGQWHRLRAMKLARNEMTRVMEKTRVQVALSRKVLTASDTGIKLLDKVLVYW